jgi:hypothetical protein
MNLDQLQETLKALISQLSEDIPPDAIARAIVDGASDSHRCPVCAIAEACAADLDVLKF